MPRVAFDGYQRGLLVRAGPRIVPPGYLRDAMNVAMIRGRLRSRPGIRPAHGAPFPSPIRGGGTHYRPDGTRDYLVASGAAIYRMPFLGDPELLPLTSLPSGEQTRADPVEGLRLLSLSGADNRTFLYDGLNTNLKWDGVKLTKMGLPTPGVPAIPVANGGTAIGAGTRDYYQTVRSPTHESELSQATRVTQGATGGQTFASPIDGADYDDPQVTQWALYRTQAGLATRFLVAIADIGLPIQDNLSDLVLASAPPAEQLVNTPPLEPFVNLVEHQSLVWGVDIADRNIVRFSYGTSEYIAPEAWPLERVYPVAHGDGDEITALASFFDWLIVFKQLSAWAITGTLDAGHQVVPVLSASGGRRQGIGCIAPDAIQQRENDLIFPSRDGFYVISRFAGATGGINAIKVSDAIDELFECTDFSKGSAAAYDRQKQCYIFFAHGGGAE